MSKSTADIDVLILAGGRGERSRPYLGNTPKFLAPIVDKPLGILLLDYLKMQGIRRVVLALSDGEGGADQIQNWLDDLDEKRYDNFDILTSVEPEPSGINSAIVAARPQLLSDPVIIINGDTLLALDLVTVLSRYKAVNLGALGVVSEGGAHSGCIVLSKANLAGNEAFIEMYDISPNMTTSHAWVDIGTVEGYTAVCKRLRCR